MKIRKLNIKNSNTTASKVNQTSGSKPNRRYKKLLNIIKHYREKLKIV